MNAKETLEALKVFGKELEGATVAAEANYNMETLVWFRAQLNKWLKIADAVVDEYRELHGNVRIR